jgi:hypothetical protein
MFVRKPKIQNRPVTMMNGPRRLGDLDAAAGADRVAIEYLSPQFLGKAASNIPNHAT